MQTLLINFVSFFLFLRARSNFISKISVLKGKIRPATTLVWLSARIRLPSSDKIGKRGPIEQVCVCVCLDESIVNMFSNQTLGGVALFSWIFPGGNV